MPSAKQSPGSSPSPQHSLGSSPSLKSSAGSSPSPQHSGGSSDYEGEGSSNASSHEVMEPQNIDVSGSASTELATTGTATAAGFQKPKPQKKKRPQKRLPQPITLGATSAELVAENSTLVGSSTAASMATERVKPRTQEGGDVAESAVGNDDNQDEDSGIKAIRSSLRRSGQLHRDEARMSNTVIPHTQDLPHLWVEQDRELRILRPENKDLKEAVDKLEGLYNSARETNVENKNLISAFSIQFQDQHRANELCIAENERLQDAVEQSDQKLHDCLEEAKKSARERDGMAFAIEGLQGKLRKANEKDEEIADLQADLKDCVILQAKAGALEAANKKLDADRIATKEQLDFWHAQQRETEKELRECEAELEAAKQREKERIRLSLQRPVSMAASSLAGDNLENLGADGDSLHSGKRFSTQSGKWPMSEKPLPEKPSPKQPLSTYPQEGTELETAGPQNFSGENSPSVLEVYPVTEAEPSRVEVPVKKSVFDVDGQRTVSEVEPAAVVELVKKSSIDIAEARTSSVVEPSKEPDSPLTKTLLSDIAKRYRTTFTQTDQSPRAAYVEMGTQTLEQTKTQDKSSPIQKASDRRDSMLTALGLDDGAESLETDRPAAQPITYKTMGVQTDGISTEMVRAAPKRLERYNTAELASTVEGVKAWISTLLVRKDRVQPEETRVEPPQAPRTLVEQTQTDVQAQMLKDLEVVKESLPARDGKAQRGYPASRTLPNTGVHSVPHFTDLVWWIILLGLILMWYWDFFGSGNDQQQWLNANDFTRQRVLELRDEKWMYPLWVLKCAFSLENMLRVDRLLLT